MGRICDLVQLLRGPEDAGSDHREGRNRKECHQKANAARCPLEQGIGCALNGPIILWCRSSRGTLLLRHQVSVCCLH